MKVVAQDVLNAANPVMPVIAIPTLEDALPLAEALCEGGIKTLEITLRTECALDAIELIAKRYPDMLVGAGTIKNTGDYQRVVDAGAKFVISPGLTPDMLSLANEAVPLIPGVMTASEVMVALDAGFKALKLFPAAAGGLNLLKGLAGPFPEVQFCPTGGISLANMGDYLSLPNVSCVGGSWLAPKNLIVDKNWSAIRDLAQAVQKK